MTSTLGHSRKQHKPLGLKPKVSSAFSANTANGVWGAKKPQMPPQALFITPLEIEGELKCRK